jgi:hypothetical protein
MRTMYLAIEDFYGEESLKKIFGKFLKEMKDTYLNIFKVAEVNSKIGA